MTILLHTASGQPLYEQIAEQMRQQILSGTLEEGTALPSIRALARDLSVSIITTKRAYEVLEHEGYIETSANIGSKVKIRDKQRMIEMRRQEIDALLEKAAAAAKAIDMSSEDLAVTLKIIYEGK